MAGNVQLFELLKERSLLGLFLSDEIIQEIVDKFPITPMPPETLIAKEGDQALDLFIVISGKANLYSAGHGGEKVSAGSVSDGRSLNLFSVVRAKPFQYSAVA